MDVRNKIITERHQSKIESKKNSRRGYYVLGTKNGINSILEKKSKGILHVTISSKFKKEQ